MQTVAAAEANRQFSALLQKVKQTKTKIADLLAMPGIENIPFDIPVWTETARPAEFS